MDKDKIWINPSAIIKVFSLGVIAKAKNIDEITTILKSDKRLRKTAEGWIAAMVMKALQKKTNLSYFLMENKEDPPDFFGIGLFMEMGIQKAFRKDIEVFRYGNESRLDLIQEISKKVKKAYSDKTILVCQITKEGFKTKLGEIHENVKLLKPHNEVWIISGGGNGEQIVSQVFPQMELYSINISDVLSEEYGRNNPAFIFEEPLTKIPREDKVVFDRLGRSTILLPDLTLIYSDEKRINT